ncbi:MAG: hypothetical protein SPL03_03160 [Succinivibrio dextrinosolvens]|nr:hypothetical protein [Succinivibrio dextrinosolvens]
MNNEFSKLTQQDYEEVCKAYSLITHFSPSDLKQLLAECSDWGISFDELYFQSQRDLKDYSLNVVQAYLKKLAIDKLNRAYLGIVNEDKSILPSAFAAFSYGYCTTKRNIYDEMNSLLYRDTCLINILKDLVKVD